MKSEDVFTAGFVPVGDAYAAAILGRLKDREQVACSQTGYRSAETYCAGFAQEAEEAQKNYPRKLNARLTRTDHREMPLDQVAILLASREFAASVEDPRVPEQWRPIRIVFPVGTELEAWYGARANSMRLSSRFCRSVDRTGKDSGRARKILRSSQD